MNTELTDLLCTAIQQRKRLQFTYKGHERVVEPHLLAHNKAEHYALSAWFVRGYSESGEPGWRQYLMDEIESAALLDETFPAPREGFRADGGEVYHHIVCAVEP